MAVTGCISSNTTTPENGELAIPPDYTQRPPRPGVAASQPVSPTLQPQETVFRMGDTKLNTLPAATARSPGETTLLEDAGAQNAPKDIRQMITNEARGGRNSATLTQRLLSWQPPATTAKAGPTPTIEPAKSGGKGFFGWLL